MFCLYTGILKLQAVTTKCQYVVRRNRQHVFHKSTKAKAGDEGFQCFVP